MGRVWLRWRPTVRTIGRWFVWISLPFLLFRFGVTAGKARAQQDLVQAMGMPAALGAMEDQGASAFAVVFASEYLTFQGDENQRAQRLKPFLSTGMDAQAGLVSHSVRGKQQVLDAWLLGVEQAGVDRFRVTVLVSVLSVAEAVEPVSVTSTVAASAESEAQEYSPGAVAPSPSAVTSLAEQSGTEQRYLALTIPVARLGEGEYVVYDLPAFAPWRPSTGNPGATYAGEEVQEPRMQGVLTGFFRALTGGTADELGVFMADKAEPIQGFGGSLSFRQLVGYRLYRASEGLLALADVEMQDPVTEAIYRQRYTLGLVQQGDRWLVETLTPPLERSVPNADES